MRAAVLTAPGELRLEDVPLPVCPPGGVLIRVKACGLCASDLKMWRWGHKELKLPRILGHEVAGVVEESDSSQIPAGEVVQVAPGMPCGYCSACQRGEHNRCPEVKVLGFSLNGGLAEFIAVPVDGVAGGAVNILPLSLDAAAASLAEPLACCLNAWQQANLVSGEAVIIFGAGPVGRLAAWSAKAFGARRVVLMDKDPARLRELGSPGIDVSHGKAIENARDALAGGADVVLPACSDPIALAWGMELINPGGRMVVFSGLKEPASLDLNQVHYRELSLVGAYGCTATQNKQALEMLASGAVHVESIISHRLPLESVLQGMDLMERRAALKVVIHPQEE
jgi:L-iditol 2-dehydrogenase